MELIIKFVKSHSDIVAYLFFGVCTTLINLIVYWIASALFKHSVIISTTIAWVLAVLFAYLTNRKWVFHSNATRAKDIICELVSFFACRVTTGVLDIICMWLFVEVLHFNDMLIKLLANFLVIILNYIASKIIIFKRK